MSKTIIFLLVLSYSNFLFSQETGDVLFDNSFLHRIDLNAANLEDILDFNLGSYNNPVELIIDGEVVDSIFIKRKGFTSNFYNNTNPPFKIKIDDFIEGQEFDGLDVFNLHNHYTDEYFQKNALSYALYRRAGVPTPRTSFAEVYINDNFIDIYTITEDIDRDFLNQNFASKEGSLYKGVEFPIDGVSVNKGTIDAFNNYINNISPENWNDYADLHNFFRVIIIDDMINTDDSGQNDYMYFEPKSEKMHFITWDHNFTYGATISQIDSNYILNPKIPFFDYDISSQYINSPFIKPLYLETVCLLSSYLLESDFIENTVNHNYNILISNNHGVSITEPSLLISELSNVRSAYIDVLNQLGYIDCNQINSPISIGDLVINEFVAYSDENGVQEPDGGTPDWIELYNNTSSVILLNDKFYLSDDKDFPKKWHFKEDVTILANDYLILWADRDIHQEGIHTSFKLKASGEDLFMTYENMTILQEINFEQQELNEGYARLPNGTGDFVIQDYTFNANNENISSISDNREYTSTITLFPNPTEGVFQIKGLDVAKEYFVTIINPVGQEISPSMITTQYIDLSNQSKGLYFVQIRDKNKFSTLKLLLE